jgi:hypothetical protein
VRIHRVRVAPLKGYPYPLRDNAGKLTLPVAVQYTATYQNP